MKPLTAKAKNVRQMVAIALFAALSYAALFIIIPVGPMFVHAGNMIAVVAALLLGGWQGSLAGALGMGLWDLLNGHADSAPKTLVLKFLIGLTVGLVYHWLAKRGKSPKGLLAAVCAGFLSLSAGVLLYSFCRWHSFSLKIILLASAMGAIGLLLLVLLIFGRKLSISAVSAIVAAGCGMGVNLAGETLYKLVYYLLMGSHFSAALNLAVAAQASTLINVVIAVGGGVALFLPLQRPFQRILGQ